MERTYLVVADERGAEAREVEVDASAVTTIGEPRRVNLRSRPWEAAADALASVMPEEKW